jgi:hypothetical protein
MSTSIDRGPSLYVEQRGLLGLLWQEGLTIFAKVYNNEVAVWDV